MCNHTPNSSWNDPVLSNEGKRFLLRKTTGEPLMVLKLLTNQFKAVMQPECASNNGCENVGIVSVVLRAAKVFRSESKLN